MIFVPLWLKQHEPCSSLTLSLYSVCSSCAPSWPTAASWPCTSRRTGPNTWSEYTCGLFCTNTRLKMFMTNRLSALSRRRRESGRESGGTQMSEPDVKFHVSPRQIGLDRLVGAFRSVLSVNTDSAHSEVQQVHLCWPFDLWPQGIRGPPFSARGGWRKELPSAVMWWRVNKQTCLLFCCWERAQRLLHRPLWKTALVSVRTSGCHWNLRNLSLREQEAQTQQKNSF